MWQAESKLYLYHVDPQLNFILEQMESILKKEEFTGIHIEKNRFSTGKNFLSHLTFMGCSPDIELDPQQDKPYCYIEVESHEKPLFISGSNLKKARCHHCKKNIENPFLCPHCQQQFSPTKLNWRKTAFLAACWIAIGNIYELEAIPNDQFLDTLKQQTGVEWKAAYIRQATH